MDPVFLSHGPASVIFWETVSWFLCAIIAILAPLAGRYLFLAKKITNEQTEILSQLDNIKITLSKTEPQYTNINTNLELLLDRRRFKRSPRIIETEDSGDYVQIGDKHVSLVDLERILLNVRPKKRRIDDYIEKEQDDDC